MSNEHEIPIGTKLRTSLGSEHVVIGHFTNGDIEVRCVNSEYTGPFFGEGPATLEKLTHYGWFYELPGPKISNKGFAKFIRSLENV